MYKRQGDLFIGEIPSLTSPSFQHLRMDHGMISSKKEINTDEIHMMGEKLGKSLTNLSEQTDETV